MNIINEQQKLKVYHKLKSEHPNRTPLMAYFKPDGGQTTKRRYLVPSNMIVGKFLNILIKDFGIPSNYETYNFMLLLNGNRVINKWNEIGEYEENNIVEVHFIQENTYG